MNLAIAADPSLLVRKTIRVAVSRDDAYDIFVRRFGQWWPLTTHHIGVKAAETAVIEPKVGGRWFERATDGTECDWGKVKVWDPPARFILAWSITADWQYDAELDTEVEVRFISEGEATTRVEVEHRKLEAYGERAGMMHGIFDSENGWSGLLQAYARAVTEA
ncbi:SRPBCC family protein [Steroidobacter sp. S1-65]|uniref:SRPBCC family protein n=1 Tax=Steroidobacter gossypii TaxID=2805490 RepID=A0ABS1WY83_9GAMM|nr:SRPBCC family protein [Steroidobacter gossypii]MBM0105926.1 SRPBCC family protein [Steroidobacter gossypii]